MYGFYSSFIGQNHEKSANKHELVLYNLVGHGLIRMRCKNKLLYNKRGTANKKVDIFKA